MVLKSLDKNEDNKIGFNEFLAATIDVDKIATERRMSALFKKLDSDGDGKIT